MRRAPAIVLLPAERRQLRAWCRRTSGARLATRARIVLLAADGLTNGAIADRLKVNSETVGRWRSRFLVTRADGLVQDAPRGGSARRVPRTTVQRIVRATTARSPAEGPPWSTRSLARSLRVNHMAVHRVWRAQGLGGARLGADRGAGSDPRPRVDLVGAYVTTLVRALVFSVDPRPQPRPGSSLLPELVPNPTGNPEFSGPTGASEELVRALGTMGPCQRGQRGRAERESALLVFLRGVERAVGPGLRLEAVFDRPLGRLGRRASRWLASHGRYRVYTSPRPQAWAEAVDGWIRRWESAPLDRGSFVAAGEFATRFIAPEPTSPGPFAGFAWRSDRPWPLPRPAAAPPVHRPLPPIGEPLRPDPGASVPRA